MKTELVSQEKNIVVVKTVFEAAEVDVDAKSNIETPKRKSKKTEDATEPTIEK